MTFYLEKPGGGLLRIGDLEDPRVAEEIGSGGAGRVLRPAAGAWRGQLIKLYHTAPQDYASRHAHKVRAMVAAPPPGLRCIGEAAELAWPQTVVRDEVGQFRGFVMPRVGRYGLDQVLQPLLRRKYLITEAMYFRLTLARSLAVLVDKLHQAGYSIIDLKPENLRVRCSGPLGRVGEIALIDTDGLAFQGPDGTQYAPGFATEEYLYPRIRQLERDAPRYALMQDRWALAVIVFRLLNDNIHPLAGIDDPALRAVHPASMVERARFEPSLYAYGVQPHPRVRPAPGSLHDHFCPELRALADQAFSARLDPPAPARWVEVLETLAHPRYRCPRSAHHWLYGETCGACALEGKTTIAKPMRPPRQRPASSIKPGIAASPRDTPAASRPSIPPTAPLWPWLIAGLIAGVFVYGLSWVEPEQIGLPNNGGRLGAVPSLMSSPQPLDHGQALPPATGASRPMSAAAAAHGAPARIPAPSHGVGPRVTAPSAQPASPGESFSLARLPRSQVRALQKTLQRLGYRPGPVDGLVGPKTRAAIRAFADDRQLQPHELPLEVLVRLSAR